MMLDRSFNELRGMDERGDPEARCDCSLFHQQQTAWSCTLPAGHHELHQATTVTGRVYWEGAHCSECWEGSDACWLGWAEQAAGQDQESGWEQEMRISVEDGFMIEWRLRPRAHWQRIIEFLMRWWPR